MKQCTRADALPHPEPKTQSDTCLECLDIGAAPVRLRLCLECGHVARCDSSPLRYATAHHEAGGHPVMRAFEPGVNWRRRFVDHVLV